MLKSNVTFILGRFRESLEAAVKGLQSIAKVKSIDPTIMRTLANTKRDLNNIRIRCVSKLEGISAQKIRH
jgi:hypothetical protein